MRQGQIELWHISDITTAQLYECSILGASGENCSLDFQFGIGYCMFISS